jgi:hypothetical protein
MVPVLDLADAWAELERAQVLHDGALAHDLMARRPSSSPAIRRRARSRRSASQDARCAAQTGREWVMAIHDAHVPEAFRPSFLQRNGVNCVLLALGPRLG